MTSSVVSQSAQEPRARLRLDYLDGLRGLTALYIVAFHGFKQIADSKAAVPHLAELFCRPLLYGRLSVGIFIVLSGYCLMLPVVRSGQGRLTGGVVGYLRRRARRILPPYYAALALALLVLGVTVAVEHFTPLRWFALAVPNDFQAGRLPDLGSFLAHLLLLHNWRESWAFDIDGPLWSVAAEWQIYFLFAGLLLPLWRRFGTLAAVGVAFGLGLLPGLLSPGWLDWTSPWYLGLFALGMAAATINFSPGDRARWSHRLPWWPVTLLLWLTVFGARTRWGWSPCACDCLLGAATAATLIACTRSIQTTGSKPLLLRVIESPWLLAVGSFSYSLYLTHGPVLAMVHQGLLLAGVPPVVRLAVLLGLAIPLCVLIAYGFYRVFERPFVGHASTQPTPAPISARP